MVDSDETPIWPEDLAFQTLARKVRDGVMLARAQGFEITSHRSPNCCCPLGAAMMLRFGGYRRAFHPSASAFLFRLSREGSTGVLPDEQMVWAFIAGFEGGHRSTSPVDAIRAAGLLGLVYRGYCLKKKEPRRDLRPRRQRMNLTRSKPPA